jgi:hypothetical protein
MLVDRVQTYLLVVVREGIEVCVEVGKGALSVGLFFVPSVHANVSADSFSVVRIALFACT